MPALEIPVMHMTWALPITAHIPTGIKGVQQDNESGSGVPTSISIPIATYVHISNGMNAFGSKGGFETIFKALATPDRCGLAGIQAFLQVLNNPMISFFLPEKKVEGYGCIVNVLNYLEQGFNAAEGLAAFEESGGGGGGAGGQLEGEPVHATLSSILLLCEWIQQALANNAAIGGIIGDEKAIHLRRVLVMRLLSSGNFNRQLTGVKELHAMLERNASQDEAAATSGAGAIHSADRQDVMTDTDEQQQQRQPQPQPGPLLASSLQWILEQDVADLVLRANLHQAQYAEQAQRVLQVLLRNAALPEKHLDFLWHFTEDATTFEDIKANVYGMLGALGPLMSSVQRERLFSRLRARLGVGNSHPTQTAAIPSPDLHRILDLLVNMARHDTEGTLADPIVGVLVEVVLRKDAPVEAVMSDAVVDVCAAYADKDAVHTPKLRLRLQVAAVCVEVLSGQRDGLVPAAARLLGLLLATESPKMVSSCFY